MVDRKQLRQQLEELERVRGELILAKYRYEEAMADFDDLFGREPPSKAIRILRSRALLKKLVLTHEALDSVAKSCMIFYVKDWGKTSQAGLKIFIRLKTEKPGSPGKFVKTTRIACRKDKSPGFIEEFQSFLHVILV